MQARPARRTMAARAVGEAQMIAAGRLVREMPRAAATRRRNPSPTHSTRTTMPPSTSLPPLSQRSSRSATGAARQTANKATMSQRRARAGMHEDDITRARPPHAQAAPRWCVLSAASPRGKSDHPRTSSRPAKSSRLPQRLPRQLSASSILTSASTARSTNRRGPLSFR